MARTWLCRCGHRNERKHLKCRGEGCGRSRPKPRRPAHMAALDHAKEHYADLNETIHGVDEHTCGLCGETKHEDVPLQRDHDHQGEGRPRGLLHYKCNRRLGDVEHGQRAQAEMWLLLAYVYLRRVRLYYEGGTDEHQADGRVLAPRERQGY